MLVAAKCNVCGEGGRMDVGDRDEQAVLAMLALRDFGQCPFGNHVELGKFLDYIELNFSDVKEGSAPTEEEYRAKLVESRGETWTTDELRPFGWEITGFSYGAAIARCNGGPKHVLMFDHGPTGVRYYWDGGEV